MPRLFGIPVVVNVDGIERLRLKWNWLGRGWYHLSEFFSTWFPSAIVTDARVIERYYCERYGASSVFIPYGAVTEKPAGQAKLDELGLAPQDYFLYVSRFEPENNAHLVVEAFAEVRTSKRLVVVGDAPYSGNYIQSLRSTRDPRILFPGAVYGSGYRELMGSAFCYVHATEVGGSHPALLEAMGQGNIIIANGTPENIEVLGGAGIVYVRNDASDLARLMQEIADFPARYEHFKRLAIDRAHAEYSWDRVVSSYEQLFARLVKSGA
jgi:glycosyltransferase involved in cell wall biosynthesis